ncbi:hypothetical protein E2562_012860 [Oryza meyeriana var. granulata]|uniref:Secreted protein n=1 Tax=Oryza meyeriana var. granulata TaxID=110450 RepID=A0A6G1CPQ4_9ORYZ|nr:hypothetical protein E2562_012860 [Oryza meyeriana var. granulata]
MPCAAPSTTLACRFFLAAVAVGVHLPSIWSQSSPRKHAPPLPQLSPVGVGVGVHLPPSW